MVKGYVCKPYICNWYVMNSIEAIRSSLQILNIMVKSLENMQQEDIDEK